MLSFYRGFSFPFAAQAIYKSVIFSTNTVAKSVILADLKPNSSLMYPKFFICGFISGSINSLIVTPVEFIRNNLIVLPKSELTSPASLLKQTQRETNDLLGFFRRMYTGAHITLLRDGIGMGVYFLSFYAAQNLLKTVREEKESSTKLLDTIISGATAGVLFWSVALPFDFIKTKVQVAAFKANSELSMREILKSTSLKDLYRGWQVALGRGAPGAAATLTVYTYSRELLD